MSEEALLVLLNAHRERFLDELDRAGFGRDDALDYLDDFERWALVQSDLVVGYQPPIPERFS